ncbi:alpha/beta hydrolase [Wolbachia endosymbiont of Dirofilaria (Dirofilaria) immitis]|uniref:alpha/beta hydrolase n=1 Tax=Wolbachia endosymbiont of Dirofilaria (Dirofilaria) immitis TaxID=1812115 RepID=UPI00158B090C|nr:alpha/beta fold hydrolase [Wolbachia endosymbiont of Dirofilaria (Dirofilaria) immitis]QKX02332.1 prolyl oligopeptidase family serine peptidase [Wolbachia endosymbiont of Dirofilaria (Dirofilaria) immitis]
MIELKGPEICASGNKKNLVVCLHGWGSSGDNFVHLAKVMSKSLPDSCFIVPDAPFKREIGDGYQWFSLEDYSEEVLYNGIKNATLIVNHFIDTKLREFGLKDIQLSLVGFSQGAMLAIHTALARPQSCASVVVYSGRFLLPSKVIPKIKSKPNVCVIHGDADDIVPFSSLNLMVEALKKSGVNVEGYPIHALGHIINEEGIKLGVEFIKKNFKS